MAKKRSAGGIDLKEETMDAGVDLGAIKKRQQVAWSTGDYAVVGTTLQIVRENLCEALDLRAGASVLDVAAGNGNATLAAARRWCEVTSTDYFGGLLAVARRRAEAEGQSIKFQEADAENLPFADGSFDVVLSTFGVMFTPDQGKSSSELGRVCKPGGKSGLANWTPESFVGRLFKTSGSTFPQPRGSSRRRSGEQKAGSRSSLARWQARYERRPANSCSATVRPCIGLKCSGGTTGR
jgi:SAM-dependent methyltransferase